VNLGTRGVEINRAASSMDTANLAVAAKSPKLTAVPLASADPQGLRPNANWLSNEEDEDAGNEEDEVDIERPAA